MADVTKYGGSGGSDFPDARRERESGVRYDSSAHHDVPLYAGENPWARAPATRGDEVGSNPMDGFARVQDILDETTMLTDDSKYILTGKNLVNHMSSIAPYCLDTEQMSLEPQNPSTDAGSGWAFTDLMTIESLGQYVSAFDAGQIVLGKQGVSSVYVDPDQDITVEIGGLAQYFHGGITDPTLATITANTDDYSSVTYSSPVYNYDPKERDAMNIKFGYTVAGEARPADTYGACYMRLGEEIDNLIEMLQAGYSERKDISRSTPNINIFDNFEVITAVENEEVIESTDSIERRSQMKTAPEAVSTTGDAGGSSYE